MKEVKKQASLQYSEVFEQKQLKILQEAIHPNKLRKDLKALIFNSSKKQSLDICLIGDNQKMLNTAYIGKKSTFIPILIYLLFTNRKIVVNLIPHKFQNIKKQQEHTISTENQLSSIQIKQNYLPHFFKEKKYKRFFQMIRTKIDNHKKQKYRTQSQPNLACYDLVIQQITFKIENYKRQNLSLTFEFLSILIGILTELTHDIQMNIQKLSIKLSSESSQTSSDYKFDFNKETFECFGYFYWNFTLQTRNIQSIEIKLPFIKEFLMKIKQSTQYSNNTNGILDEEMYFNIDLDKIYRIQIQEIRQKDDLVQISSDLLNYFLKLLPRLKVIILKTTFIRFTSENSKNAILKDSFKLFRTISQSNRLLQVLYLSGIKLNYEEQKPQSTNQIKEQDVKQSDWQKLQNMDRNLFWLQKMQQNCPYLSFFQIQFIQKDKHQQRRLLQNQRKLYHSKVEKTKDIISLFYKRGMNNQTYFNTIKVLQAQQYDYETILGILDKIDPFVPI